MPELIACPQCSRQLNVPDSLMGQAVQCPACKLSFTAALTVQPSSLPVEPALPFVLPAAGQPALDFSSEPPTPHRGGMVLTLGLIGFFLSGCPLVGWICGYLAWSYATTDLSRMQRRQMDPDGRLLTQIGYWFGLAAIGYATFEAVVLPVSCVFWFFVGRHGR